jgi:hypothetical protein
LLTEYREEGGDFFYFLKMREIVGMNRDFEKALKYAANVHHLELDHEASRELLSTSILNGLSQK